MTDENQIQSLLSSASTPQTVAKADGFRVFDSTLLGFTAALSNKMLTDPTIRVYPELVALGFWLRPANVNQMIDQFRARQGSDLIAPRGIVFHIAPANVDTIFVYSWVLSLLCGNRNIVRLSSKTSPQIEILLEAIGSVLQHSDFEQLRQCVSVIRYDHSEEITASLSSIADTRVIWGGDETVQTIRKFPIKPTANEVAFPNKLSFCIIDRQYWENIDPDEREKVAKGFTNDAFWFGQAACSSPRGLIWHGGFPEPDVRDDFWQMVHRCLPSIPIEFRDIDFVNKRVASDLAACSIPLRIMDGPDNRIIRNVVDPEHLPELLASELHCGAGQFFETSVDSLVEILPALNRKIQTISVAGVQGSEFENLFGKYAVSGIDRIVSIGAALDFSSTWDGFDLFEVFLRRITVETGRFV